MSRSLTDMSDFVHQVLTPQEPATEMSLQIPRERSVKRTLAEQLSDAGPNLLSQMMTSPQD